MSRAIAPEPERSAETAHACVVNSWNEWDPLEEVVVGRLEGAAAPPGHVTMVGNLPARAARLYPLLAGRRYPRLLVQPAQKELGGFVRLLESEGIKVRRPDIVDFSIRFSSPNWTSSGFCTASPRDGILVIGDQIIETPMAWRSRYFETHAYRTLLKEYWSQGARWISAPKPQLLDRLYDDHFRPPAKGEPVRYIINEFEPLFDAADFVRCGTDLFVTRSNATNASGIEWLRRHLGPQFRIHEIKSHCPQPLHIDTTFVPLAPGKVLINPEYVDPKELPPILKSWDILVAPEPDPIRGLRNLHLSMVSKWISLNVLMLDPKRVVVERSQVSMIELLKDHGLEPIPCPFMHYKPFGGSFHCATLDVRRRGTLQSYF
ncbi:MAG: amidinotransferase [Deltaproteobacteria bacterium]|nr:MAG: amidinotransferase [Deltaproteobacteria bacterium]